MRKNLSEMEIEVITQRSNKKLASVKVAKDASIGQLKVAIEKMLPKFYPDRQSLKAEPNGKMLKDDISVSALKEKKVYFKDLGPQLGWSTVFMAEYAGPLFVYLLFYLFREPIYGKQKQILKGWMEKVDSEKLMLKLCFDYHAFFSSLGVYDKVENHVNKHRT